MQLDRTSLERAAFEFQDGHHPALVVVEGDGHVVDGEVDAELFEAGEFGGGLDAQVVPFVVVDVFEWLPGPEKGMAGGVVFEVEAADGRFGGGPDRVEESQENVLAIKREGAVSIEQGRCFLVDRFACQQQSGWTRRQLVWRNVLGAS